jgi:hypothetical protein
VIPGQAPGLKAAIGDWIRGRETDEVYQSLLQRLSILDAALALRFHVTLADVTPEEFQALVMFRAEREEWRDEQAKKERAIAEAKQRSTRAF